MGPREHRAAPSESAEEATAASPTAEENTEEPGFLIHRWEIWYVYACYLSQDIGDLAKAAEKLLKSHFGEAIILPDGQVGWRNAQGVAWGLMQEEDSIGAVRTAIQFPPDLPAELREPVFNVATMRSAARHVFSLLAPASDEFMVIALPQLVVYLSEEERVPLEVNVRLFESGIVLVSFRSRLASTPGISLESFIHWHVNLPLNPLYACETDRSLAFLVRDSSFRRKFHFWQRPVVLRVRTLMRQDLLDRSGQVLLQGGPLAEDRLRIAGSETAQLSGIALEYVKGLAYALGGPRAGLKYILLGEPGEPRWNGYWTGSPHVHLLGFSNQSDSAGENERRHAEFFKQILIRHYQRSDERLRIELPRNTRPFDDFAVYAHEGTVLWVYTTDPRHEEAGEGIESDPFSLPTFQHQVKGDLLEYGPILYKSLLDELEERDLDWERVFTIKERQARFEIGVLSMGRYGEIRDMLAEGFRLRRVENLKENTASLLALRESIASVTENKRLATSGMVLAVILSLLGVPGVVEFMNEYVAPHISLLAGLPERSLVRIGILAVITIGGFSLLTAVGLRVFRRFARIRWRRGIRR